MTFYVAVSYNEVMILTDVHTHSAFSADGTSPLSEMVNTAKKAGFRYFGVSEHFDYDYKTQGITAQGKPIRIIDAPAYFAAARVLQRQTESENFRLLAGGEFGFANKKECFDLYAEIAEKYRPDFIVNSVHTCAGRDCFFTDYFDGKTKEYAYSLYLEKVLESLEAPYPFDVVAHVGYVARNAPYPDPKLRYEEYSDLLDGILREIAAKNKILEVNTSARTAGSAFLPDTDILTRYFQLGGREITFSSDAHAPSRIGEKRETVCEALKRIGFSFITVPDCGKRIKVGI